MSVPGVSRNWGEEEWERVKKEEKGRGQAFFSHSLAVSFVPFAFFWK